VDPVTDIEYPVKDMRFVPGVDFLGLSALVAVLLFSTSFMFRRRIPREIPLAQDVAPAPNGTDGPEATVEEQAESEPENKDESTNPEEKEKRLT
jgi:hypothetical protein